MTTSSKIKTFLIIFFIAIFVIIAARHFIGLHFKKKFSVRPAPGVIVSTVEKSLFYKNDFLSFRIKQDPRIEKARVSLNIPKGRNPNGVVEFKSVTLPITPSGREINFETSWSFHRDNRKSFINLSFIDDKDHIKSKDIEINLIFAHQRFF